MSLIAASLISDLEALWAAPVVGGDPVTALGNALETYWNGATVVGLRMVPVTPGVTLPDLVPLRNPVGTAVFAAAAFQSAMLTMVLSSLWPTPAVPPPIPNPISLQAQLLPIISFPSEESVASSFGSAIDAWCRGTLVNVITGPGTVTPSPVL